MPNFLAHLKEASTSPFAFVAYICVVAAWVYVVDARHRLKTIAKVIEKLPENERAKMLSNEYKVMPRSGLSAEQWIRSRRQTLLFISFLATLVALIAIIGMTYSRSAVETPKGAGSANHNQNKNSSDDSNEEIPPLEDPVDVTYPSPSPSPEKKGKSATGTPNSTPTNDASPKKISAVLEPSALLASTAAGVESPDLKSASYNGAALDVTAGGATGIGITRPPAEPKARANLELYRITEGRSHSESVRVFDITLANKSDVQKMLKDFQVSWKYIAGGGANNQKPYLLKPVAKYKIVMPINRRNPEDSKVQCVCPSIVIPPGSEAEPNLVTLRVYLSYTIDLHPYTSWDILFSISITDDKGGMVDIFKQRRWKDRPYPE